MTISPTVAVLTCFCGLALGQSSAGKTIGISGRVADATLGWGLGPLNLTLATNSGEFVAAAKSAQGSGAFTFAGVSPGAYKLYVIGAGLNSKILTVDATAGNDVNIGTIAMVIGSIINTDGAIEVPTSTLVEATVCEILKDPSHFHNKNVRVRAEAGAGIDTSPGLFDRNCEGEIELELPTSGPIVDDLGYRILDWHLQSFLNGPVLATVEGKLEYILLISDPNVVRLTVEKVSDVIDPRPSLQNR